MTGLILLAVYIAIFVVSLVIVAWATKQLGGVYQFILATV
jgi:hypothetical protein